MFTEITCANFRDEKISELGEQVGGKSLTSLASEINRPLSGHLNVFEETNNRIWINVCSDVWRPTYDLLDQQIKNQIKVKLEDKFT